ncbi:MAG: efflux RND transporter periplasmic adaptor subunit, partial [Halieaceae bacterium]|nr:efflux RND transporter periplasmic adaptor subunit [Halieaceae bacterium]
EAGEAASELVLRKPQLEAARARVLSARAALTKAQLDLERTRIRAPFSGRVLAQLVDFGQVVNAGTTLAEVYATDYFEVRLPLRNTDLAFIELPEDGLAAPVPVPVRLRSDLGGAEIWQGRIVRTEGAIDRTARQLHVVAQIDDPFGKSQSRSANAVQRPLKIGEYVTAQISGKLLADALVIPSETIYQNSYVYIVENGELQRRDLEIAWQNGVETLLYAGLDAGDALVTTPLGQISSGTPVQVVNPDSRVAADVAGGAE